MERPNLKICIENDAESESDDDKPVIEDFEDDSEDSEPTGSVKFSRSSDDSESDQSVSVRSDHGSVGSANSVAQTTDTLDVDIDHEHKLLQSARRYENKNGEFVTGFDPLSAESQQKREQRASRFGIKIPEKSVDEKALPIDKLYDSLGISEDDLKSGERGIRLNAVHVRGLDEMSTQDVFQYFREYGPGSLEWIDDTSCNVVWGDEVTAARALINLSKEIPLADTKARPKTVHQRSGSTGQSRSRSTSTSSSSQSRSRSGSQSSEGGSNRVENMEVERERTSNKETEEKDDFDYDLNLMSEDEEESKEHATDKTVSRDIDQSKLSKDAETGESNVCDNKQNDPLEEMDTNDDSEKPPPVVPPGRWRHGSPFLPKAEHLFLRFATKADQKVSGAERRSQYYRKYGNPNFRGMKGLISTSRKRRIRSSAYRKEQELARKMVTKNKNLTNSESTTFDLHMDAAENSKTTRNRLKQSNHSNSESEDEAAGSWPDPEDKKQSFSDVDEELRMMLELEPESPPVKKRFMKMYADEIQEKSQHRKPSSGLEVSLVGVQDRLSQIRGQVKDARSRITGRLPAMDSSPQVASGDLRSRLGRKRHSDDRYLEDRYTGNRHYSKVPSLTIEIEPD